MVATAYRAQWSSPLYGDPGQNTSNTFYFLGAVGSSQEDDIDEILGRLQAFYQAIDSVVYSNTYMSNNSSVIQYDLSDPEPRTPIAGPDNIALTIGGASSMPADVSICLSYHAAYPSGANRARRRGRVYLGPILASTISIVTGQGARVTTAAITAILDAVENGLLLEIATPITWAVYSETDKVARPIVEYSIDNGLDTRRSRDNRATTRTSRSV